MSSESKESYTVAFEYARRLTVPEWLALVDDLEGHKPPVRSASTFAVLCDELYEPLVSATGLSKHKADAKTGKKVPKMKAADVIRMKSSVTRVEAKSVEFKVAASKGPLYIKRFLSNDLYELRGLVLMWHVRRLS